MTVRRIAVVEFGHSGHHADYMRHLVRGWPSLRRNGADLHVAVSSGFRKIHADVFAEIAAGHSVGITVAELDPQAEALYKRTPPQNAVPMSWTRPPGPPPDSHGRVRWDIAQNVAAAVGADRLLLMELDPVLPVLAARCRSDAEVCGIWFRAPIVAKEAETADRHWALHQRALACAAFGHPQLQRVFSLDPRAAEMVWLGPLKMKITPLPDPVTMPRPSTASSRAAARARFAIPPERIAALHFGQVSRRKDIASLMAAIERMTPSRLQRLSLLIAGPRVLSEAPDLEVRLDRLRRLGVQIVFHPGFVAEELAQALFEAADVVLVAYHRHIGMSGVLLRAAAHGRPVLSQRDGLMGQLVCRHRLGVTVDTEDRTALTGALSSMVDTDPRTTFDPTQASAFAFLHDATAFQETLYSGLFDESE
jgi:glycosyltransferase involved in cell wall biosynthesis